MKYLLFADNSRVFGSLENAIETLFSFWYRSPESHHLKDDSESDDEYVRNREYGLNLKLATMKLGKSCLLISETAEKEKFVIYFSVSQSDCPES